MCQVESDAFSPLRVGMDDCLFKGFKVWAENDPARSLHGFVLKDGSDGSHLRQGNQSDDKGRVDRFPCFAILEKVTQTVLQSAALFLRRVVDECEDVPPTAMGVVA